MALLNFVRICGCQNIKILHNSIAKSSILHSGQRQVIKNSYQYSLISARVSTIIKSTFRLWIRLIYYKNHSSLICRLKLYYSNRKRSRDGKLFHPHHHFNNHIIFIATTLTRSFVIWVARFVIASRERVSEIS